MADANKTSNTSEFIQDQVLLQHPFRVWSRGSFHDYHVTMTYFGLNLFPIVNLNRNNFKDSSSKAKDYGKRSYNCKTCCEGIMAAYNRGSPVQVLGRDIVSCRPAVCSQTNPKINAGPPIFMLVVYPSENRSNTRTVLYFHWSEVAASRYDEDSSEYDFSDIGIGQVEDEGVLYEVPDVLLRIARLKDEWVRSIHEVYFPFRNVLLASRPERFKSPFFDAFGKRQRQPPDYLGAKLLVVLNPTAKKGFTGLKVFREQAMPVLRDALIDFEILVTEYPRHIYEIMRYENLARWKGVVCLAGDGTVAEIYNGLFDRHDWQDALAHLPVCAVPLGCRNAFARSLIHAQGESFDGNGLMSSIVNAARGQVNPLDLMFVQTKVGSKVGVTGLGWGVFYENERGKQQRQSQQGHLSRLARLFTRGQQPTSTHSAVLSYLPLYPISNSGSSHSSDNERSSSTSRNSRPESPKIKEPRIKTPEKSKQQTTTVRPDSRNDHSLSSSSGFASNNKGELIMDEDVSPKRFDRSTSITSSLRQRRPPPKVIRPIEKPPKEIEPEVSMKMDENNNNNSVAKSPCSACSNSHRGQSSDDDATLPPSPPSSSYNDRTNNKTVNFNYGETSIDALLPNSHQKQTNHKQKHSSLNHSNNTQVPLVSQSSKYNYTSLLTDGQLYFRSWQELDVRLVKDPQPIYIPGGGGTHYPNNPYKNTSTMGRNNGQSGKPKRPRPHFPLMPELPKPLPKEAGWITEVGDFVAIHVLNHSFIDEKKILVPEAVPDDGILWLMVVRAGISAKDYSRFLKHIESLAGESQRFSEALSGEMSAFVEIFPIRGLRLAPLSFDSTVCVDGEHVETDGIQVFVMPGVARTLVK